MANRWGNSGNIDRLYFLGLQNHCRWWLHHEFKRCLLIGSKAMTNLDSVIKSKDITFLTKFCLVKAMVFPVVRYGCESCTIKKAEQWRIDALFFPFIFISWRLITLQYCSGFCHTLTWISHGVTCIPHPDPPSHLPLYPIPLGLPSAPGRSTCLMHPTWAGDLFHPR